MRRLALFSFGQAGGLDCASAHDQPLVYILAPIAAILGHNYSLYLPERDENGRFKRLRGGAGGAPALGGAVGLWPPALLIILPLGAAVFFGLGIH